MSLQTSSRLFALLGHLQARATATGPELAALLGVGERTVRKDVERLRELGYPVEAVRGAAGGYRFGDHGRLPPLLLEADEAVAVAVGLGSVSAVRGIEEAGALALAKLQHVLPDRLWRRVRALSESTDVGPADTGTNVAAPPVDVVLLADLATAIRDREGLRLFYRPAADVEERVEADPYRLVSWQQRWYVVVRHRPDGRWRALRADWIELRTPGAGRFSPDPLAGGDYAAFVLRDVAFSGWSVHCRIAVDAPGGGGASPDQPDRGRRRDRRRGPQRAGHRRRQRRDGGGVDRDARPGLPRRPSHRSWSRTSRRSRRGTPRRSPAAMSQGAGRARWRRGTPPRRSTG